MSDTSPRMQRECRTIEAMIVLYCHERHGSNGQLCAECEALRDYARQRLDKCPFQGGKTTCARCPIHCYKPAMREKIRDVMRTTGPRMVLRHPVLAVWHLFDDLRKEPVRPERGKAGRAPAEM